MPIRRELNQNFFKKWSPEMAYVLGFFAADGSMIRNQRGGYYIEFTITDRIVLKNIRSATGSTHKIAGRKRERNRRTIFRLQIGSRLWFTDLTALGFMQNKSTQLRLPVISAKYFGDFVRGYFDGDGCVYFKKLQFADRKKPRHVLLVLFTSGSRRFLEQLWEGLKTRGVKGGSLKEKNRGFDLVFSSHDSLAIYQLMYDTAKTSVLYLPRKRTKLEQAIRVLQLK